MIWVLNSKEKGHEFKYICELNHPIYRVATLFLRGSSKLVMRKLYLGFKGFCSNSKWMGFWVSGESGFHRITKLNKAV
jgi:hypothetical protein